LALKKIIADMGDNGLPTRNRVAQYGVELTIIQRPRKGFYVPGEVTDVAAYLKQLGYYFPDRFKVLPKRWIVERT
jgi:transposase